MSKSARRSGPNLMLWGAGATLIFLALNPRTRKALQPGAMKLARGVASLGSTIGAGLAALSSRIGDMMMQTDTMAADRVAPNVSSMFARGDNLATAKNKALNNGMFANTGFYEVARDVTAVASPSRKTQTTTASDDKRSIEEITALATSQMRAETGFLTSSPGGTANRPSIYAESPYSEPYPHLK